MTNLDPHIFRAYDIRGKAHEQVTTEACRLVGQAFGSVLREMYGTDHPTVAVGRDARIHSLELQEATMLGLIAAGCKVYDIGETPTPVNYFATCHANFDGGIQITASHNPKDDNGLKLQIRNAIAFCGDDIQALRKRIDAGKLLTGKGAKETMDATTPYVAHLTKMFGGTKSSLHVAVDTGNGIAGPVTVRILKSLGYRVTELYTEPDGTFPHHIADPVKWDTLKDLQRTVKEAHADIGLAFDGDGDRLGVVDEKGTVRSADSVLLLLAQDHLRRNQKGAIIFTVSSSSTLETEIAAWGGTPVMTIVGHAFVEHAMEEHGSLLGGEQSGHFFCFEEYYHFDDALVAGLRVLRILKERGAPLSARFEAFPKVYQAPERRPHCPDGKKAEIVRKITAHFKKNYPVNDIDGARIDFGDGAWAGIRQSNTSPCLSICMEARSPKKLKEIEGMVLKHLEKYPEIELER